MELGRTTILAGALSVAAPALAQGITVTARSLTALEVAAPNSHRTIPAGTDLTSGARLSTSSSGVFGERGTASLDFSISQSGLTSAVELVEHGSGWGSTLGVPAMASTGRFSGLFDHSIEVLYTAPTPVTATLVVEYCARPGTTEAQYHGTAQVGSYGTVANSSNSGVGGCPQINPPNTMQFAVTIDSAGLAVVLGTRGRVYTLTSGQFDGYWSLRLIRPGAVSVFGSGCVGSNGTPALAPASEPPWIGERYSVIITNLPNPRGPSAGYLVTGFSNTSWMGVPLPFNLGPYGWRGCFSHVSADMLQIFFAQNGVARIARGPLPPAIFGVTFYDQALVADPLIPRGASVSNAVMATVGAR